MTNDDPVYIATTPEGVERSAIPRTWPLPSFDAGHWTPGATVQAKEALVLKRPLGLLDGLDDSIFIAEALGDKTSGPAGVGTTAARLVRPTGWNAESAAGFALDCAEHALGEMADAELPDGTTLGEVIRDARTLLERLGSEGEARLAFLARLSAARRLRKRGEEVGAAALAELGDDAARAVSVADDPAWTTLAALSDAVLAAVEALRHLALPRYFSTREESSEETEPSETTSHHTVFQTPWGAVIPGATHVSPYAPAWVGARDAADRAIDSLRDRAGESAAHQREWQAELLAELLRNS